MYTFDSAGADFTGNSSGDEPAVRYLIGFHIAAQDNQPAVVNFYDGAPASGDDPKIQVRLPGVTGGNSFHFASPTRMIFEHGVYVEVDSGDVLGSIQPG